MKHITHFIDGKPWDGIAARQGDVFDPATGAVAGQVDFASAADMDTAVAAAVRAAAGWREASISKRTAVMFAMREILHSRRDELAAIVTDEHGKVLSDAAGEVQRGLEVIEYACGIGTILRSGFNENVSTGVDSYAIRQPLGVVGVISPFNFPAMVPLWFVPIALATGNAVILKPSEKDPSAAVKLAEWFVEAGLPQGVFNVVHGDKEAVDALLDHKDVKSISFVGSTPIARYVYERGTGAGKRVQALGGAKNHMVVLPDADIDLAADAAVSAGFGSAGERCMAISVVVAVDPVGDDLIGAITDRMAEIRTGDGAAARLRHGAAGQPASTGTRSPVMSMLVRPRVRRWWSTGGAWPPMGSRTGSGSDRRCSTMSRRRCRSTPMRSSGRCCRWYGCPRTRTRSSWSTRTRTATGPRSLPTTVAPPAAISMRSRSA